MKSKQVSETLLTVSQCAAAGMSLVASEALVAKVQLESTRSSPQATWLELTQDGLHSGVPFALHEQVFSRLAQLNSKSDAPLAAWCPSKGEIAASQVMQFAGRHGFNQYSELWSWANQNRWEYWNATANELDVVFKLAPSQDPASGIDAMHPDWFSGGQLNIADSCFAAAPDKVAIVAESEDGTCSQTTYAELEDLANQVACGLAALGFKPSDRMGLMMPMSPNAIAAFLGIVRAGCVPVPIAESFAAPEIGIRLELAQAKGMIVSDVIHRGGKQLACYSKVEQSAWEGSTVVVPAGEAVQCQVGDSAILWRDFLRTGLGFESHPSSPSDESCILFSSGTTGIPKAIPWTHATPIKCAADARFHQNVHSDSILSWPTSLGWMMGPWLVYAALMNRATMAIYSGSPTGSEFCRFVQQQRVTMLGVVPSLVAAWRRGGAAEDCDWQSIENFSSTGECSNASDMLYLMSRADYRPVIEYCGGTEIGGGYVSGTVVQPCVPSAFSTPALGLDFRLLQDGHASDTGEVFLVPPSVGLSERLLNADHDKVYYAGTPQGAGDTPLRRHGDQLQRLPGGYFRASGRTDDTMNLGGIKVSSVEIERCLNQVDSVNQAAAVGWAPAGGGPTRLCIFVVLMESAQIPDEVELQKTLQAHLREHLNPLYRIQRVELLEQLPRTASNKILRRDLRDILNQERLS